jgi:hypothetical protein
VAQHALRDPEPFGSFLDLHFDPFPRCRSTLTLVAMSRANFKGRQPQCGKGSPSRPFRAAISGVLRLPVRARLPR